MQIDASGLPVPGAAAGAYPTEANKKTDNVKATDEEESSEKTTLDEIREKGFQAYVDEIKERKKEELREKILRSMGLSEEQLAEMAPEQRKQIEDVIAEEIRRRMATQAAMNEGETVPKPGQASRPGFADDIQNGMGSGLTLIKAMEEADMAHAKVQDLKEQDDG